MPSKHSEWAKTYERRLASNKVYALQLCPFHVPAPSGADASGAAITKWLAAATGPQIMKLAMHGPSAELQHCGEYLSKATGKGSKDASDFYACCWLRLSDGALAIAAGGAGGAIHIVDAHTMRRARMVYGHGAAIVRTWQT